MDLPTIECQVCHRPSDGHLPFNCVTCAQNLLYEPRLELATSLLSTEALGDEIEQAVQEGRSSTQIHAIGNPTARRIAYDNAKSATAKSKQRTKDIMTDVEAIRQEMEEMRAHIKKQRSSISTRRTAHESATENLKRQQTLFQKESKEIAEYESKLDNLRDQTAGVKTFLCKETAALYGLQPKRRRKSASGRETFLLGGSSVIDLRDLNTASPVHVTASIARVAHLIHLTSHYLGLRLPAEITLPCAEHPYPVIRSPLSSYKTPMLVNNSSYSKSQTATRIRPLRLEKTLPTLASDDPVAYGSFIDAITLLAWNIAWVARTQHIEVDINNWEDICAMGKTLWLLFSGEPHTTTPANTRISDNTTPAIISEKQILAQYSHSTTRTFLASAADGDGMEYMRTWYFASPARLIERIKSALASERMGAEWEMLEKDEWEGEGEGETPNGGIAGVSPIGGIPGVRTEGGISGGKREGGIGARIDGTNDSGNTTNPNITRPPTATVTAGRPSRSNRTVTATSAVPGVLRAIPEDIVKRS